MRPPRRSPPPASDTTTRSGACRCTSAYAEWLKSDIADTNNAHANAFAGSTVAALFLDKFVGEGIDWAHFDTFAWRPNAKPGRPKGGAALGLRAALADASGPLRLISWVAVAPLAPYAGAV